MGNTKMHTGKIVVVNGLEIQVGGKAPRGTSCVIKGHNESINRRKNFRSKEYQSYLGAVNRCFRRGSRAETYKKLGIGMWVKFLGPDGFYKWLEYNGKRPIGMTIDRIDSLGHYMPGNLRWSTISIQNHNIRSHGSSSKYKGVYFDKAAGRWRAHIGNPDSGKQITIGRFSTEEEAAIAYDKKAVELYGENASLNFPRSKK
jgi:hypothetical protein